MAYLGPPPSQKLATPTSQYFSGNGSATVFTLNRPVNVAEDLNVFVNNVAQQPGAGKSYTATGTTLTFDAAPDAGTNNVYVVYRGLAEPTTRLEHPSGQPIAATTGTFSGALTATTGTFSSSVNVGTIKDAGNNATALTIDSGGITTATGGLNVGTIKEATGTNTAMTIDSDGVVKITQNPCFFIKGNNGAYVNTSPVVFALTVIDTRSGVDLANNRYIVPVAGRWHFHIQLGIVAATGTNGACYPIIRKTPVGGGAVTDHGYSYYQPINNSSVTSYSHLDVDAIVDCDVGDSFNIPFVQTTSTYYNGANECRFFGYFLG